MASTAAKTLGRRRGKKGNVLFESGGHNIPGGAAKTLGRRRGKDGNVLCGNNGQVIIPSGAAKTLVKIDHEKGNVSCRNKNANAKIVGHIVEVDKNMHVAIKTDESDSELFCFPETE